jgi:hypothetical protein
MIDQIRETQLEEEKIEHLQEVVDIDDEIEQEEDAPEPQLYSRILSDKERRKLEKVQAKADKDAEKERKRIKMEILKVELEKEKTDQKVVAIAKL